MPEARPLTLHGGAPTTSDGASETGIESPEQIGQGRLCATRRLITPRRRRRRRALSPRRLGRGSTRRHRGLNHVVGNAGARRLDRRLGHGHGWGRIGRARRALPPTLHVRLQLVQRRAQRRRELHDDPWAGDFLGLALQLRDLASKLAHLHTTSPPGHQAPQRVREHQVGVGRIRGAPTELVALLFGM